MNTVANTPKNVIYSIKPSKVLRLSVSNHCNSSCIYCCWDKSLNQKRPLETRFSPKDYLFIAEAASKSGHFRRIMLTGGEPLMLPNKILSDIVFEISRLELDKFWICTSGTLLEEKAKLLADAGLQHITVSLPAHDEESYHHFSGSCFSFKSIIAGIELAVKNNISVKVDVPVYKDGDFGIYNYERFLILYDQVKRIGVTTLSYFRLHKTDENADIYKHIFYPESSITKGLKADPRWTFFSLPNGLNFMQDKDGFIVLISGKPKISSANCLSRKCGPYCQGTYAVYVENEILRFCHHKLDDQANEIDIYNIVKERNKPKLMESLRTAAVWA